MYRTPTRIPKLLILLLLGAEKISAYAPLAKNGARELCFSRTHLEQPRSTIIHNNRGRRRLRKDGSISNRFWSSSLASSFSSDDDRADELDLPINGDKLKDDGTKIEQMEVPRRYQKKSL